MDTPGDFGAKLRELRQRKGCSLQKVADRLAAIRKAEGEDAHGIHRSYFSDLERGVKPPPSRKQIARLAQALQCTEAERAELFTAAGYVPPSVAQAEKLSDRVHIAGGAPAGNPSGRRAASAKEEVPPVVGPPVTWMPTQTLPAHDATVRLSEGGTGPYSAGDTLLLQTTGEIPADTFVACRVGPKVVVRRHEGTGPAAEAGEVLGQVVGAVRLVES